MLIDRHHDFFHRQFELFGRTLHDADIGLMGNQPIDVSLCLVGFGQCRARSLLQYPNRQLEHSGAIHFEQGVAQNLPP